MQPCHSWEGVLGAGHICPLGRERHRDLSLGVPITMAPGSQLFGLRTDAPSLERKLRGVELFPDSSAASQLGHSEVPACVKNESMKS